MDQMIYTSKRRGKSEGAYHVWVFQNGHVADAAPWVTGEQKPHMWNALPTLSKSWFKDASLSTHHVISHLEPMYHNGNYCKDGNFDDRLYHL